MSPLRSLPALILLGSLLGASASLPPLLDNTLDTSGQSEHKRVFVRYKAGHHDAALRSLQQTRMSDPSSATKLLFDFEPLDAYVLDVESAMELQALQNDSEIEEIHQDPPRAPQMLKDSVKPHQATSGNLRNGNSQEIPWGVQMVQAPEAWKLGIKGQGVKVCVIDSGIYRDHEDLDPSRVDGAQSSSSWFTDEDGHGTHVAGTIGAVDNHIGVVGVAPEAEIYTVKYFTDDSGFSFASTLISAAYKCRDAGAKIINMSLGGPNWNPFEMAAFSRLLQRDGILSFAASGNDGGRRPSYPASYSLVTSVAAVDQNLQHAYFSQQNGRVDLAAPGVDILSLLPQGSSCALCQETGATNGYGTTSGTSMATPHVAGVAALLWSYNPDATANDILQAMEQSATDLGDVGKDHLYGHGLVNVLEAIKLLNGGPVEVSSESSPLANVQSFFTDLLSPAEESEVDSSGFSWFSTQAIDTTEDCGPGLIEFKMSLNTDAYASETRWELGHAIEASDPLFSESGFKNSKEYHWRKCIPSDCYTFVIHDSMQDGICCEYGSGSFTVSYGGEEIASGGDFTDEQFASMGACSSSVTSDWEVIELEGSSAASNSGSPIIDVDGILSETAVPTDALEEDPSQAAEVTEGNAVSSNETSSNCLNLILDLTTDNYPSQTSFQLIDVSLGRTIWDHSDFEMYSVHQYSTCQAPSGCYEFTLQDSHGDGLCCEYGFGGFELSFGDDVVASHSDFEDQVQVQFGEGCTLAIDQRNGP